LSGESLSLYHYSLLCKSHLMLQPYKIYLDSSNHHVLLYAVSSTRDLVSPFFLLGKPLQSCETPPPYRGLDITLLGGSDTYDLSGLLRLPPLEWQV
jgi:hypothetical protein